MKIRKIDLEKDRATLLEFHSLTNYESTGRILRHSYAFPEYSKIWLNSNGVAEYLKAMAKSLEDKRTIAEIWEEKGQTVAYIWVRFSDYPAWEATVAEIDDILVIPEYQGKGIATKIIKHVEKTARERGAVILRSGTGIENIKSQGLHKKTGFETCRVEFEKQL
jgi:GNAT superfamily N-acetyltransferase